MRARGKIGKTLLVFRILSFFWCVGTCAYFWYTRSFSQAWPCGVLSLAIFPSLFADTMHTVLYARAERRGDGVY